MTYTETVTKDRETHTGTLTDAQALNLVRRARRLGYTVTAAKDGAVTIVRERAGRPIVTVILRPAVKRARLSETQYGDLAIIDRAAEHARLDCDTIRTLVHRIPKAATRRLIERGLVVADGAGVRISLAGRLAMAAYQHQVWTSAGSEQIGSHIHMLTGARVPDYGYFASAHCTCHGLRHSDTDRATAQRAARIHLEGALTAALNRA